MRKNPPRDYALAKKITEWRQARGLKISDLAVGLGVTRQRASYWEHHGVPEGEAGLIRLAIKQLQRELDTVKSF